MPQPPSSYIHTVGHSLASRRGFNTGMNESSLNQCGEFSSVYPSFIILGTTKSPPVIDTGMPSSDFSETHLVRSTLPTTSDGHPSSETIPILSIYDVFSAKLHSHLPNLINGGNAGISSRQLSPSNSHWDASWYRSSFTAGRTSITKPPFSAGPAGRSVNTFLHSSSEYGLLIMWPGYHIILSHSQWYMREHVSL